MMQWWPYALILMFTGGIGGVLAGLLGVGGGIIIVPVLFVLLQRMGLPDGSAMALATATSLLTIVPTSLSSAWAHHRRGNVDFSLIRRWSLPMAAGVVIASLVTAGTSGSGLSLVFGCCAVLVAANMLLRAGAPALWPSLPSLPLQALLASLVGFFSVLMGVGAGTLGVPTMTSFNVPPHRAVGTAALFGLIIALPSSLILLFAGTTPPGAPPGTIGLANLPAIALILPGTTLLAPYGVRLGARLDGRRLKQVFAMFLAAVGLRMLWQNI